MSFFDELLEAMGRHRRLRKHRTDSPLVLTLAFVLMSAGFGLFFAVVAGVQAGNLGTLSWWQDQLPANALISVCVVSVTWLGYRLLEHFVPEAWLDRVNGWHDWRTWVFYTSLSIGLALAGVVLGLAIVGRIWTLELPMTELLRDASFWRQFMLVSAVISLGMSLYYRNKLRAERLQSSVTEAQLRLLQGQIEPHFMFNTLANVQSLIDFDPERAKQMLERFTDYLRAGLGQLRGESGTLAQEFEMLEAYLGLMQLRMGERLKVELRLPAELSGIELPPLLAQPLVENAVHHGIEPQIAGGTVSVCARRVDGRLWIEVADDGQGLDGPKHRAGNGMALGNIRARLEARFGPSARLELLPRDGGGTLARLQIPLPANTP